MIHITFSICRTSIHLSRPSSDRFSSNEYICKYLPSRKLLRITLHGNCSIFWWGSSGALLGQLPSPSQQGIALRRPSHGSGQFTGDAIVRELSPSFVRWKAYFSIVWDYVKQLIKLSPWVPEFLSIKGKTFGELVASAVRQYYRNVECRDGGMGCSFLPYKATFSQNEGQSIYWTSVQS